MKTFDDLEFQKHRIAGRQAVMEFDNGYGVSVITGPMAYGGDRGLYELAVLKGASLCYDTPVTDDVIGYLSPKEVSEKMAEVQALPKVTP
jgi:hypothetical protein